MPKHWAQGQHWLQSKKYVGWTLCKAGQLATPLEHVPLSAAVWLQQPVGDSHRFIAPSICVLEGLCCYLPVGMDKRGSTLTLLLLGEALS